MSAWAAIASASITKAAVDEIVKTICHPASSSVPSMVATPTVSSRLTRRLTVRRNSQPPERAELRTAPGCGAIAALCLRARRATMATYTATMPH